MILDNLKKDEVVYCREREGRLAVTTIARFDKSVERVEVNDKGQERVVTDHYLHCLRSGKQIVNPTNVWRNASEYQALRAGKKVKLHGDFEEEKVSTERAKV